MFPIVADDELLLEVEIPAEQQTALGRSFVFDYENKKFLLASGSPAENISDVEKVKQWLVLLVNTVPERYAVYKNQGFGIDTAALIGLKNVPTAFINSEFKRELVESCRKCPLIENISAFSFRRSGSTLKIDFTVSLHTGESEDLTMNINDRGVATWQET